MAGVPPAPNVVAAGVAVGDVPVGGMTFDAAKTKVIEAAREKIAAATFKLRDKSTKRVFHYEAREFGGYFDTASALSTLPSAAPTQTIPLPLKLDARKVTLHIERIAEILNTPSQEPHIHFLPGGESAIGKGHPGRALDVKRAVALVSFSTKKTIDLPFVTLTPKLTASDLSGLDDTLISFTTTFHPSQSERTHNLMLAATLYNCVLLSNMEIVERHPHSLPVHYVEAGRDATVSWGGDDFKFRNTTSRPIIVRAVVHGGTLTEMLIGDKSAVSHPDAQVAIHVSPKRTYPNGYAVTAYRIVKEGGTLIAREPLGTSFYHNPIGGLPH